MEVFHPEWLANVAFYKKSNEKWLYIWRNPRSYWPNLLSMTSTSSPQSENSHTDALANLKSSVNH